MIIIFNDNDNDNNYSNGNVNDNDNCLAESGLAPLHSPSGETEGGLVSVNVPVSVKSVSVIVVDKEKEEKIWTYHFKDVLLQCEKKADGESLVKI